MRDTPPPYLMKKSIDAVRRHHQTSGLHRTLNAFQLTLIGIGCIVGAGIYVMVGTAAANYAGPAVILSFFVAAFACAMVCLCYAELASVLPASGASYTYAYAVLGEGAAWLAGWMLMFEFTLAGSALASGFSGYLVSLLRDFGVFVPEAISRSHLVAVQSENGSGLNLITTGHYDLVAVAALLVAVAVLVRGIKQSAAINALLVLIKAGVLVAFILAGAGHIDTHNWTPFVPANEGGFHFGAPGILRAASILFFAYLGFEAVATAASEAKSPQRDVPIGILGSLGASTILYAAVALVMTGLVPFRQLGVPDPIAVAVSAIGMPLFSVLIKIGALAGLGSVLLVNTYAQSRVFHAIARDGLLPQVFVRLHARFKTPVLATCTVALASALGAALLPISVLADLVSLGTICIFSVVAISVMSLRTSAPELERPFRVPLGGWRVRGVWIGTVPILALLSCLLMATPVLIDIVTKAQAGQWIPAAVLGLYLLCGFAIYAFYGVRHSHLRQSDRETDMSGIE
ncbi:MAG: amino acid permease [Asticcacaulis sp.]|uniref:amino acid permease n=1 Tax=Asticcacaulis sp. TaxID=1872648 RepID=UPI0039E3E58D